ncbi:hypothetical protein BC831DRAFT_551462 [Entophlyctis helioformis]|nr:hypothetical protein BC831DRAFT_551462 [Entophlyctis helioformis]
MDPKLVAELDEFEDFVDSFASQMDAILKGTYKEDVVTANKTVINKPPIADTKASHAPHLSSSIAPASEPPIASMPQHPAATTTSSSSAASRSQDAPISHATPLTRVASVEPKTSKPKQAKTPAKTAKPGVIDYSKWDNLDDEAEDEPIATSSNDEKQASPSSEPSIPPQPTAKTKDKKPSTPRHVQVVHDKVAALREAGNTEFKFGRYKQAISLYTQAIETSISPPQDLHLTSAPPSSAPLPLKPGEDCSDNMDAIKDPFAFLDRILKPLPIPVDPKLYTNRAFAFLKTRDFTSALSDCTSALELDPCLVKALWRRIDAYRGLGQFDQARADAERVKSLLSSPNTAKADVSVADVDQVIAAITREESEMRQEELAKEQARDNLETNQDKAMDEQLLRGILAEFSKQPAKPGRSTGQSDSVRVHTIETQARLLVKILQTQPVLKHSLRRIGGIDQLFGFIKAASSDEAVGVGALHVVVEACRGCPENARQASKRIEELAGMACGSSSNRKSGSLVEPLIVELLAILLDCDKAFAKHEFAQTGPHGAKLGYTLLESLALARPIDTHQHALAVVEQQLAAPSSPSKPPSVLMQQWGVSPWALADALVGMVALKSNPAAGIGQELQRKASATRCLMKLSLLTSASRAMTVKSCSIIGALATQIHSTVSRLSSGSVKWQAVHATKDTQVQLLEASLATMHNILALCKGGYNADISIGQLFDDTVACITLSDGALTGPAYRLLAKLSQTDQDTAASAITRQWAALGLERVLVADSGSPGNADHETCTNAVQLLCVWVGKRVKTGEIAHWLGQKPETGGVGSGYEVLAQLLKSRDRGDYARLIGNTAHCITLCAHADAAHAERFVELGVVDSVIHHMQNTKDAGVVKNLSICCAALCKTPKGLERARQLRWVEHMHALSHIIAK